MEVGVQSWTGSGRWAICGHPDYLMLHAAGFSFGGQWIGGTQVISRVEGDAWHPWPCYAGDQV